MVGFSGKDLEKLAAWRIRGSLLAVPGGYKSGNGSQASF